MCKSPGCPLVPANGTLGWRVPTQTSLIVLPKFDHSCVPSHAQSLWSKSATLLSCAHTASFLPWIISPGLLVPTLPFFHVSLAMRFYPDPRTSTRHSFTLGETSAGVKQGVTPAPLDSPLHSDTFSVYLITINRICTSEPGRTGVLCFICSKHLP